MPKTYFCTECKSNHRHGKIWEEHKKYRKGKTDNIPIKKILKCNWNFLRPIAQRQILHYVNKLVWDRKNNGSDHREMYIHEINKIILHED